MILLEDLQNQNSVNQTVFCKPDKLSDHHTLGMYSLRLNQDTVPTHYIVPQYHLIFHNYHNYNIAVQNSKCNALMAKPLMN